MSFRYHGKYCGPGWSAGKYQKSVKSNIPGVDEFDESCRRHDAVYATPGGDRKKADQIFYKENIGRGFKRTAAALAVGAQSLFRPNKRQKTGTER